MIMYKTYTHTRRKNKTHDLYSVILKKVLKFALSAIAAHEILEIYYSKHLIGKN